MEDDELRPETLYVRRTLERRGQRFTKLIYYVRGGTAKSNGRVEKGAVPRHWAFGLVALVRYSLARNRTARRTLT